MNSNELFTKQSLFQSSPENVNRHKGGYFMNYMPYANMINPNLANSPFMKQPVESLEEMYPDSYKIIQPKIQQMCMIVDTPENPDMYPYPNREAVEQMANDIHEACCKEMGIMGEEEPENSNMPYERQFGPGYGGYGFGYPGYGYPGAGFGRRRFLRDLVGILLIRELLGRRGQYIY
jgi:hypothetical protein